jgi:hypothetical protein
MLLVRTPVGGSQSPETSSAVDPFLSEIIEDPEAVARTMRELVGNQSEGAAPRAASSSAPSVWC